MDPAFAVAMSATGQRSFIRVCKADMVLETSGPQMPVGLGSPQCGTLLTNSLEPHLQPRAESRSLKCQTAGLVYWGGHHALSHQQLQQSPRGLLANPLSPPALSSAASQGFPSLPCPRAGSDLGNFTYQGRCFPVIPHCPPLRSLRVTLMPGFGSGYEGPNPCLAVPW